MQRIESAAELEELRKRLLAKRDPAKPAIAVCAGAGCHGLGNAGVIRAFGEEIERLGLADEVDIRATGCHGLCEKGPNVVFYPEEIYYIQGQTGGRCRDRGRNRVAKKVIDRLCLYRPCHRGKSGASFRDSIL